MKNKSIVAAVLILVSGVAYSSDLREKCDSTCKTSQNSSSFKKTNSDSVIDKVDVSYIETKKACAAGFLTASGNSSFTSEITPIFGFYSEGVPVKSKMGSAQAVAGESCFYTEFKTQACDVGFSGVRNQKLTKTQNIDGSITDSGWSTYSNTCSKTETKAEACPSNQVGSIEKERIIQESNSGDKIIGAWSEKSNTCVKAPESGLATGTVNGFETAPVVFITTYNSGFRQTFRLKDQNGTYATTDHNTGIYSNFTTREELNDYFCKYQNYCVDTGSLYTAMHSDSYRLNGEIVAYWYSDGWNILSTFYIFPKMPRFTANYILQDAVSYGSGAYDSWLCPNGFGLEPSRNYCSRQYYNPNQLNF